MDSHAYEIRVLFDWELSDEQLIAGGLPWLRIIGDKNKAWVWRPGWMGAAPSRPWRIKYEEGEHIRITGLMRDVLGLFTAQMFEAMVEQASGLEMAASKAEFVFLSLTATLSTESAPDVPVTLFADWHEPIGDGKRLTDVATPGPWTWGEQPGISNPTLDEVRKIDANADSVTIPAPPFAWGSIGMATFPVYTWSKADLSAASHNARFIAMAREALPRLLAELERLRSAQTDERERAAKIVDARAEWWRERGASVDLAQRVDELVDLAAAIRIS
jgi:hypothetical protein